MACIDLRSLSLNSAAMYWLAAAGCGRREKHVLNVSRNPPRRCKSARADVAVTPASVEDLAGQYKAVRPAHRIFRENGPDKVVLAAPMLACTTRTHPP